MTLLIFIITLFLMYRIWQEISLKGWIDEWYKLPCGMFYYNDGCLTFSGFCSEILFSQFQWLGNQKSRCNQVQKDFSSSHIDVSKSPHGERNKISLWSFLSLWEQIKAYNEVFMTHFASKVLPSNTILLMTRFQNQSLGGTNIQTTAVGETWADRPCRRWYNGNSQATTHMICGIVSF